MLSFFLLLIALAVPFLLWPWGLSRIFRVAGIPYGGLTGALAGPLFFAWFLGALVLLLPGLNAFWYTLPLALVPAGLLLFIPRAELAASRADLSPPGRFLLIPAGFLVLYLFGITLVIPPHDHDILVVQSFVDSLRESWLFWDLPRYEPDERGFYYPLAHPPAMMSTLAWLESFSDMGWVTRLPSAVAFVAIAAGLFLAGLRFSPYAAYLALLLSFSAPLFLKYTTNNSQDVFRHAAIALALAAFVHLQGQKRLAPALVAGALLGVAAAYHSMGLLLGTGILSALCVVAAIKRAFVRPAAAAVVAFLCFGAYPYIGNVVVFDSPTIETTSAYEVPTVSAARSKAMTEYSATRSSKEGYLDARLALLTNVNNWGAVMIAFVLLAVPLAIVFARRKRLALPPVWWSLFLMSLGFVYLVLDPGDFVHDLTGYRIQTNRRYPLAALPVFSLVAAAAWGELLREVRFPSVRWTVVAACFFLPFTSPLFDWSLQMYAEPGRECVLCADAEKLEGRKDSGMYRAVTWLDERSPGRRCIAFREGAYFAWSRLAGVPYYAPSADRVYGAPSAEIAFERMREASLDCIVLDSDSSLASAFLGRSEGLRELRDHPDVWTVSFADAEVWMLGDSVAYGQPVTLPSVQKKSDRVQILRLPKHEKGELAMNLLSDEKLTVVSYWDVDGEWERAVVRLRHAGPITIPTLGAPRVRVVTSHPATITDATFRRVWVEDRRLPR